MDLVRFKSRSPKGVITIGTKKIVIGLLILVLLGIGGFYWVNAWRYNGGPVRYGVFTSTAEASQIVQLEIKGMKCSGCSSATAKVLMEIPGVEAVEVDWKNGNARVQIQKENFDKNQLVTAVNDRGFTCTLKTSL